MSLLPLSIFIGGAMMLFGTSNMLPNAPTAMHGPLRRLIMQAIVSLFILGVSVFVISTNAFHPDGKHWAYASVGMVVGYWLKSKWPATPRNDTEERL
jgi:hypothetical protein